jgi:UDP-N-acetylmuramoyl-L-alanyl-D-glutamate--2,6-diaminopimelate ligase
LLTGSEITRILPDARVCFPQGISEELRVSRIVRHSDAVEPGDLFVCIPGVRADGHEYAEAARRRGAAALLVERPVSGTDCPQILVPRSREAMGKLVSALRGNPSSRMQMVAVTGTNGKSTTTYMIRSILERAGRKTGLLGTIVYDDGLGPQEADRTTPEADELQEHLACMVENGCEACVMEASSHGLEQGRLGGCLFDAVAFTNLTPEHLDYHGDMERYFKAKESLFDLYTKENWVGTVNGDDPYGRRIARERSGRVLAFSLGEGEGVLRASILGQSPEGTRVSLSWPDGDSLASLDLPLLGRYNVENALTALGVAEGLSIPREIALQGLQDTPPVPGRMERISLPNRVACVIDYAHSPDGLEKVLTALRVACPGKLWAVFGHGGNRYVPHRPRLGEIAAHLADRIVLTSDNPRNEDPFAIARQIAEGVRASERNIPMEIILDRGEAIRFALDRAEPGDLIALTGKGPERFIVYDDRRIPFEDRRCVLDWAERRGGLPA